MPTVCGRSAGRDTRVAQTGQKQCWDSKGEPIACAGTGQDGDIQAGVPWPTPRFIDNGDGTVTDNLTGLVWLKNANPFGFRTWEQALTVCNSLASGSYGLTDGSAAGDWRLPNIKEIESLVDYGHVGPCLPAGHPFVERAAVQLLDVHLGRGRPDRGDVHHPGRRPRYLRKQGASVLCVAGPGSGR